jgi:hypothetical protein
MMVLRSALLLAALFVACGRTVLDDPVDVTGTAGATVGSAGAVGAAGIVGTAGSSGTAGTFVGGTAGFVGGTAGFVGTAGLSGTAGAGVCGEGATECFSTTDVGLCKGGQWIDSFTCPNGCFAGVCEECRPSTTQCATAMTEQLCQPNGIWGTPMPCAGGCVNGSCDAVQCVDGDTRCTPDATAQQTCVNGAWTDTTTCEYVCVGQVCAMNLKKVFVTSQVFDGGSLGGLTGADADCTSIAHRAGLTGTFMAWLSDVTGSPATRFSRDGGPYELTDGTEVAHNWTELTEVGLVNGITASEFGMRPMEMASSTCGPLSVWTDTKNDGTLNDTRYSCDEWSNLMGLGAALGVAGGTVGWTDECMEDAATTTAPCAQTASLYCFEQ